MIEVLDIPSILRLILNFTILVHSYIEQVLLTEDVYSLITPLQMVIWNLMPLKVSASSSKPLCLHIFCFIKGGIRMR